MAKALKQDEIVEADIAEFLATRSDFTFELTVLRSLRDMGWKCEHGGTYRDPVTNISRQFDIRANTGIGQYAIYLAVECKCLNSYYPLVVCQIPRRADESFHEIIYSFQPNTKRADMEAGIPPGILRHARFVRLRGDHTIYWANQPVGKSTHQVGRSASNDFASDDRELYEKWSQAIASSHDLVSRAEHMALSEGREFFASFVCPVVVVPDRTLWAVSYSEDGVLSEGPRRVERCSMLINKAFPASATAYGRYVQSHLEIMTLTGLETVLTSWYSAERDEMHQVFDLFEIQHQLTKEYIR